MAEKGVEVYERTKAIPKVNLFLITEFREAVTGGLQLRLHARVVVGLPLRLRQVEDLCKRLNLGVVINLHTVKLVLEFLETVRIRGAQQLGMVVVGSESVADVVRGR